MFTKPHFLECIYKKFQYYNVPCLEKDFKKTNIMEVDFNQKISITGCLIAGSHCNDLPHIVWQHGTTIDNVCSMDSFAFYGAVP